MNKVYLENPLNRRKAKYKFYLRSFENYLKLIIIYLFLFPLIVPFLLFNYLKKNKFAFKDFYNQNASVFIVSCLKYKNETVFLFKFFDFHRILNRFGIKFILKNFSLYLGLKDAKELSFIDRKSDYYFNTDYFYFFDNKIKENQNNYVLPFYLNKHIYLQNQIEKYQQKIKLEKKFKIIFSGSSHKEWYAEHTFKNIDNQNFLNRTKILDIIKSNFSEKLLVVNDLNQVKDIDQSNKEILIVETNPEKFNRKKIFTQEKHLDLISSSNFFLCMPGGSMPLCYHLIESCLVGTVPILSYNEFLNPKFSENEALFFFNENDLIEAVNKALNVDQDKYLIMQKNIINYYNNFLSPKSIYKSIMNKNLPLEIFTNVDHTSSRLRRNRIQKI